MFEHMSYGQVNPQNFMAQLGLTQLGGAGIDPSIAAIDPLTAAYLQQQLVSQASLGGVSPWSQTPYGLGSPFGFGLGQQQFSPQGQIRPYGQGFGQLPFTGQIPPYSQMLGHTSPFAQTSPWQTTPYGLSPYAQIAGQGFPWAGQLQTSPYSQLSPYTQFSPFGHLQPQSPLAHWQAALASQYTNPYIASAGQQPFGRVPFGISPYGQQFNPVQQLGFPGAIFPSLGRGVSPFGQGVGVGSSPFQNIGGYGTTQ